MNTTFEICQILLPAYEIKRSSKRGSPPSSESSSPSVLWPFLQTAALPVCGRTGTLLASFFVRLLQCWKEILCRNLLPSRVVYLRQQLRQSALSCHPAL